LSIEERIEELENKVRLLESATPEEYVTPKQLAEKMQCSTNHIYVKIREGEIRVASRLGACVRIPMSQFKGTTKKPRSLDGKTNKKTIKEPKSIEDIRSMIWN